MSTTLVSAHPSGTFTLGGDLPVYRLGFGAMRITGAGVWGDPPDREGAKKLLRRVTELGVNFIDTADAYGPGNSEALIGEALHPYAEGLVVATKGGLLRPERGAWTPDGSPKHLREACEASLKRLRVERIDLYQLHSVDSKVPFEDSVGALAELRKQGKVRHVGLSNVSAAQLAAAQKIVPIVSVQNRYGWADRSSESVLVACEKTNVGFIPWYPLGAGELAKKQADEGALGAVAREHKASTAQVALAWLLRKSKVMLPIPGTSSIAHLEENVRAAQLATELTEGEVAKLDKAP